MTVAGGQGVNGWVREALTVLGFAALYFLLDTGTNRFAFTDSWTIVWPLNGLTIGLLMMRPRSRWWSMLIGVELGTGVGECLVVHLPLLREIGERACSVVEVVFCARVLPPFDSLQRWLRTPRINLRFVAALVLGPGISGVLAGWLYQLLHVESFGLAIDNWAGADAVGIAATLPLVLAARSGETRALLRPAALPRTLAVLTLAFLAATLVFGVDSYPMGFLLYPVLLMTDLLLGFAGAAIAVFGICLLSIYLITSGYGPFGHWNPQLTVSRDLAYQIFFGFHLVALFPASIVLMERRRMADALRGTNAQLSLLASLDGLTEIANRRTFNDRFDEDWRRAQQLQRPLALLMIDLDSFKPFNDSYGHLTGDRCLRAVATALARNLREPQGFVARFGGEEFAVLLRDTTAIEARVVAQRLLEAVQALGIPHAANAASGASCVTISIGFASLTPSDVDSKAGLAQLADAALYQAKRLGRNRIETIDSAEALEAARPNIGSSSKLRLLRLIGG